MRHRPLIAATAAVVLAVGVSACGSSGSGSSADNGIAGKSPAAIVKAATAAVNGTKSVHISGSLMSSGMPITLDLSLVSGTGATGSMTEGGLSFQLIALKGFVYIKGSPGFWKHFGGAAAAKLFQGKWLKASSSSSDFASLGELTDLHALFKQLLGSTGTLSTGKTSTVDGQKVVAVNDTTKGGTLYVATTGKPYPVEIVKTGANGGHVTFDQYNASVTLAAPSGSISLSQLTKLGG
jgi:hypothetical protein